jgi:DNA-binding transcriptional LysR family regulator
LYEKTNNESTMENDLSDLNLFLAVCRAGGFREAARATGLSPSGISEAMRRLEARLGLRLLNRTTRSVVPTDAGRALLERLEPALNEVQAALDAVHGSHGRPSGTLRLNVPLAASRLVLPAIVPRFLAAYPDITLEVTAEDSFVDVLAAGCDAGIRYEERLEQDMIAVPIGPRVQRMAAAASPSYLARHGQPAHPSALLEHACLGGRFAGGPVVQWDFEQGDEKLAIKPRGPLIVRIGITADLLVDAALAGTGIVYLFEDWLRPQLDSGALMPVLETWWPSFPGPYLYYPGRRLVPPPLRAFIDFIRSPG